MRRLPYTIQRLTLIGAWSISILISLLAPATYYLISYQYMRGVLEAQTALRASDISRVIHANPAMWRYEEIRLAELIERRSLDDIAESLRVTDPEGAVIVTNTVARMPLRTVYIHNIYDAGHVVAHIEAALSLEPLLYRTLLVAIGSTAIGFLIFFVLRTLPLQTINKSVLALKDSENKYRLLYETMKEGMALHRLTLDDNGVAASMSVIDANPNCIALLGGDRTKIIGTDSLALFGDAFKDHFSELLQVESQKGSISFELTMPGKDNLCLVHAFSPDRGLIATLLEDITERKRAEEERLNLQRQLLHAQKLESLGILSGGIAHDFNNLLHALLGNLEMALMKDLAEPSARENIEQAIKAGTQAAKLTSMMLAYTGKGVFVIKKMNLTSLVENNASLLAAAIPRSITFDLALDRNLPPIMADEGQLQQVVMNLITNAAESIGDGRGSIRITTGMQAFSQSTLNASRLEEKLTAGRYVFMEVIDTGCGMDDDTLRKLFDPFFTTKFTGRGLGLSAVQGILRAHKAAFLVESRTGAGTAIRILFPIAGGSQTPQQTSAPAALVNGKYAAMVLIVDDEEMIRNVAVAMLKRLGFETLSAADGEEALRIMQTQGDRIGLVLLDQNMPRMDGVAVFRELKKIRPGIKVLLASGFSEVEVAERYSGMGLNGFVKKPYNIKQLSDGLQRALKG